MEQDLARWCRSVGHPPLLVAHIDSDGSPNQFKYWESFERTSRHQTSKNTGAEAKEATYGCHSFSPTAHGKGTLSHFINYQSYTSSHPSHLLTYAHPVTYRSLSQPPMLDP
jgi:hypothetical protein